MKSTVACWPCITFKRPAGAPAFVKRSARIMDAPGTRSDGFRIAVFPHATDIGNDHSGIIAGKLNGQMDAVTPKGTLYEIMSMSVAMLDVDSPICSTGIDVQTSTISAGSVIKY